MIALEWTFDVILWSHPNFIFIPTGEKVSIQVVQHILHVFKFLKFLNNLLVLEDDDDDKKLKMVSYHFLTDRIIHHGANPNTDVIFPDKLKDMQGYVYKIIASEQFGRLVYINGKFSGPDVSFIDVTSKLQNANYVIEHFDLAVAGTFIKIRTALESGAVDLYLNTQHGGGTVRSQRAKLIQTFETNGFCALVPSPKRLSYLSYILTPFDYATWIFLFFSMIGCTLTWKLYKTYHKNRQDINSVGHFVFGTIANFFLQAIPFRQNPIMLVPMTQSVVFMMMILGNAYQSLLISVIAEPHYTNRITKIDEMLQFNYHYKVAEAFGIILNVSNEFPNMSLEIWDIDRELLQSRFEETAQNKTVYILQCDMLYELMNGHSWKLQQELRKNYFILPEKFYSSYDTWLTGAFSPFNERLSEISLNVLETGIKQHWMEMHKMLVFTGRKQNEESLNLLTLFDLMGVFLIHCCCLAIATFTFLMELLWSNRVSILKKVFLLQRFHQVTPEEEAIELDELNDLEIIELE